MAFIFSPSYFSWVTVDCERHEELYSALWAGLLLMGGLSEISILFAIKFHLQGIIELLWENPRVKSELIPDALCGLFGGSGNVSFWILYT